MYTYMHLISFLLANTGEQHAMLGRSHADETFPERAVSSPWLGWSSSTVDIAGTADWALWRLFNCGVGVRSESGSGEGKWTDFCLVSGREAGVGWCGGVDIVVGEEEVNAFVGKVN